VGCADPHGAPDALGFLTLGVGIVKLAAAPAANASGGDTQWIPIGVVAGGFAFTLVLWAALVQEEERGISAKVESTRSSWRSRSRST